MTKYFNKLSGFIVTPPGFERHILRALPKVLFFGSLLFAFPALVMRGLLVASPEWETTIRLSTIDIYCISLIILHWTAVLTLSIAAFIVMVMKGPAYVADPYPLEEVEELSSPR